MSAMISDVAIDEETLKTSNFSSVCSNIIILDKNPFINPMFFYFLTEVLCLSQVKLKEMGYSALQMKNCGFDCDELREAGFDAVQLRVIGFSPADLRDGGFTAKQVAQAGFNLKRLRKAGFHATELQDQLHVSIADLRASGFTPAQLKVFCFCQYIVMDCDLCDVGCGIIGC
jgi:ribosomal protein L13E